MDKNLLGEKRVEHSLVMVDSTIGETAQCIRSKCFPFVVRTGKDACVHLTLPLDCRIQGRLLI